MVTTYKLTTPLNSQETTAAARAGTPGQYTQSRVRRDLRNFQCCHRTF